MNEATRYGKIEVIEYLIKHGVDLNFRGIYRSPCPLSSSLLCITSKKLNIFKLLSNLLILLEKRKG